jgi:hypothetical protein
VAPPTARFQLAFDEPTPPPGVLRWQPDPVWTDMDDELRISEYSIDRGRSFELDRVDTGRATVQINDTEGILDPTNPGSPHAGKIMPLIQARLAIWDPVRSDWFPRYRGFVESYRYEFDPSQLVNRVTIELVDIFEIVQAVQMFPGFFGDPPPTGLTGQIVFMEDTAYGDVHGMQRRIVDIIGDSTHSSFSLGSCNLPPEFYVVFSGNIGVHETSYSPGESAMTAIQDAVDAEFPAVANVYGDRLGRLCVHGRYARFDPLTTEASTPGWDFHDWKAGDHAAVAATPGMAHLRSFSFSRDLGKVINHALASPVTARTNPDFEAQVVQSDPSKDLYGIRAWSSQDLIVKEGVTDGLLADPAHPEDETASWAETKKYADYYVRNYQAPHNRIDDIGFRSMNPGTEAAADTWALMSEVDINDRVTVTIGSPGGGGFTAKQFFVEGVHETYRPAGAILDDVTLTLDLSPADYYQDSPFAPQP